MFIFWWSARLVDGLEPLSTTPLQPKKMKCSILDYVQLLMISPAGQWTQIPSATPLQPKKWNAHFWITFNFWCSAGLVDGLEPHWPPLSSQKHEMLIFGICSTSDDRPGCLMDSNLICHPSPAKKMKCSFLDCVQLLMMGWAGRWTWTPSTTHLQPKNEMLIFGLCSTSDDKPGWSMDSNPICHPSPAKKNEMLIFRLHSTFDDQEGWSMDSNPICHPSPAKKMKCSFLGYVQLLMISQSGRWTWAPSATPLQPKKNEMLIFELCSTSDDQPGWSMDSNPICHLSPAKKMKCSFLDYVQILMFGRAGRWTWTPYATHLQPKKWNAHFWIMFNFWWSARLLDGLKPHQPPLSSQKKWNAHFWVMFNFWCSAGLVDGLEPHLPPLSSQKHEMLVFGLHSTSDDQPGWSMDLNPICHPYPAKKNEMLIFGLHSTFDDQEGWSMDLNPICDPSPATKMKCSFLDYVQLLMISWIGQWTQTPSTTPLQPKTWNACFGLHSTSDDRPGWSMHSNPICHLSPAKKMKCSFLDYIQLLMIGWAGRWTWALCVTSLQPKNWNAHFWVMFNFWWLAGLVDGLKPNLPPLSSQKNEMLVFGLPSTSDDWPGWSMDSNPIYHFSPATKMKCSFLDYVSTSDDWLGWSMDLSLVCHLSAAKKWNAHFWVTFNFWWLAGLVDGLEPHLPPLSSQKN